MDAARTQQASDMQTVGSGRVTALAHVCNTRQEHRAVRILCSTYVLGWSRDDHEK